MRDLNGVGVVVTGKIDGESRQSAEAKLRDAGAIVQSSVGRTTELLVTGAKVGRAKLDAAAKNGVEVAPWETLWRGSAPAAAWEEIQPSSYDEPVPVSAPRKRYGPMLCKPGEVPTGDGWLHEVKWDGYRCVASIHEGEVAMISRSAKSNYVGEFPQIASLLAQWPSCVLDGELVTLDDQSAGMTNARKAGASFVVFDVLELDGTDVRSQPLAQRRRLLEHELGDAFATLGGGRIVVSPVFEDGKALLQEVADRDLEGIVSKPSASTYVSGHRGWVKVKLACEQEFVVVGFTPGKGALAGKVGGLVLAVREGHDWVYVGRVGAGPTDAEIDAQSELLLPLALEEDVFGLSARMETRERKDVVWLAPEFVVQVAFQKWSVDGRLTIPTIRRFRDDKEPLEVTREEVVASADVR